MGGPRGEDVPLPFTSSRALPTRQPTRAQGSLKRGKTLTRPERHVVPAPLIAPPIIGAGGTSSEPVTGRKAWDWWVIWSYATTWWAPPAVLKLFGIKEKQSRQAWREKITLCWIALLLGAVVGFATMGLQRALCPGGDRTNTIYQRLGRDDMTVSIEGWVFNISSSLTTPDVDFYKISKALPGQDVTNLFIRNMSSYPACNSDHRFATTPLCASSADPKVKETGTLEPCPLPVLSDATFNSLKIQNTSLQEGYSWDQVAALETYLVVDGLVLNMQPYLSANPAPIAGDDVDFAIRQVIYNQSTSGKDITRLLYNTKATQDAVQCLQSRYLAGYIDKITPGCFVADLFLYTSLIVILGVVVVRFIMACIFNWFLSARLVKAPEHLSRAGISPAVMPEGANMSVHNKTGTAPWASEPKTRADVKREPMMNLARIGAELFTICMVTCYSEGEASVRGTVESIASTNYSDSRKLIWIVCDGMITGAGEKMSTPDICVSMLDADPRFGNPMPMGYIAVGSGAKRENRAMVYAGHYNSKNGHRTPTIVVVKCGMPGEAKDKPGNRGKRDSQLIVMNFLSRVTYNDRMSPLDFDLFRKIQTLTGVTPDYFETILMVDADTKIYPDSLKAFVNCLHTDNMIMGVCGETRIANKRQSWVTAIQVYEYFISHHLVKAFESVFGGVTCLPGCFSMYRIKARKDADNDWVPILVKPEIVREYSQNVVSTLHQKNLLLLGEDRFLTTILLRTFPRRKNIFLPQARCRTIAPDTFSVLLSQRRRWINSTIHNLMELVRVRDLCGTFCFSMQFVVFMDLIGTVVLPVAICLTFALIIRSALSPPQNFQEAIPLMLLGAVIGLPAILILITTRKVVYIAWMAVYLVALPVWNFVLPVYAFWHFDDFSWGETRRVEGEIRSKAHDDKTAVFDGTTIPLRRWEDWERSRLRKLRREEKRRRDLERQYGSGFHGDELAPAPSPWARSEYESDANSVFSSEEDVWGSEIGGYNENNPAFPPPPIALPPVSFQDSSATLGQDEMAAILDSGFDDVPPQMPLRNGYAPALNPAQGYNSRFSPHSRGSPFGQHYEKGQYSSFDPPSLPRVPHSASSISSSVDSRSGASGHAKKRSGGAGPDRYGPLGPLADDDTGWGSPQGGYKGRRYD
ncbi:chitin synthase 1 [Kockovaella imperatae]|uniref:chitin synthase n=1 Tax=Kockovaella imperatae TaxID=4999 RepID=A0A1Y1UQY3_9TREE|nr:chitin synthase 1 [Kockovaella imperatae]ORX40470.1 chitin synthase 1 [Kockovaella imperatae]